MRTPVLIVACVAGLLGATRPAEAWFHRWGGYGWPYYPYAYPFYPPPAVYMVPPPVYYPPPIVYAPPPIPYARPLTFRRPRPARRPVQPVSVPSPQPRPAPAPPHNLYPPERSTN